ncbi:GFA family protein [Sulfitobacter sp. SK012]|uniref:GFA family protein n=1 Tax=Sulfitobacter sp. SK012 TaxID=1389005 RepID=UPI000E0A8989|nr:GFA family protein [Sulfitobacter sp. SK012]AXI48466.1 GFA family protein [Sulfitobacter sp. SK012]
MSKDIKGQCLCGAVTVSAKVDKPRLRVCHCDMCRQHTSGGFYSIETLPDSINVAGPAQSFISSDWAERGFCSTCGSTLWYGMQHDGSRNLAAGLFPDAGGGVLKIEFFTDMCPAGYRLAGDHKKLSTEETTAMFAPFEGDAK